MCFLGVSLSRELSSGDCGENSGLEQIHFLMCAFARGFATLLMLFVVSLTL